MTESTPFVCGRRAALVAAGVVGVGTVAACSGGGSSGTASGSGGGSSSAAASGSAVGATTDVPVGGGTVFASHGVVVTQPESGTFKAFTDICTHQGGTISEVEDKVMICPVHGSEFSITDGSVVQGPATEALPEKSITVKDGTITLA